VSVFVGVGGVQVPVGVRDGVCVFVGRAVGTRVLVRLGVGVTVGDGFPGVSVTSPLVEGRETITDHCSL
jgi:hypothetical protein